MPERVIVCGGRDFQDRASVFSVLDQLHASSGIECLIEGGAEGADTFARDWAEAHLAPENRIREDANWTKYGKAAGPIRNSLMLTYAPTLVIAFPGHTGTADMVTKAKRKHVEVWSIAPVRQDTP